MPSIRRSTHRRRFALVSLSLSLSLALVLGPSSAVEAIEIVVTPSVLDLVSTTAVADGTNLSGVSQGDRFTLGYHVKNRGGDDIYTLFTSIVYDPTVVRFVEGAAYSIFEQDVPGGGFGATTRLNPLVSVQPRVTSPSDTLTALSHVVPPRSDGGGTGFSAFWPTNARGSELAIAALFEVLDPNVSSSIDMLFLPGDAAVINATGYCGVGSASLGCDVHSDAIFDFRSFRFKGAGAAGVPIPEPNTALLLGLGLLAMAMPSRDSRR